jgi:DNA-binding NtrC family response regulator
MGQERTVLVVDDDPLIRETLQDWLTDRGLGNTAVDSAAEALDAVRDGSFDVVLSDIMMAGQSGMELLAQLRESRPDLPVILMTGFASVDSAVAAMRAGAFDYVTKPFKLDAVMASLERAFQLRELERENARLRRAVDQTSAFGDLIGRSPAMREIYALIRKVASSSSSVLITGESGTGKEVVARTLHFTGTRAGQAFVPINCTAMPEGLLESELFGHVKGAFTGAHATKKGLFEEADRGTLFLDEIGDMPLALQAKMLRVLQDREIRPVGGTRAVKVDVRIVAATNKDLHAEIEKGTFRKDLYYRLNVIPLRIPPLRERPEDIPLLAEAFLRRHAPDRALRISPAAMELLSRQHWDGNARELENAIERALVLCSGSEIGTADLAFEAEPAAPGTSFEEALLAEAFRKRMTLRELGDLYIDRVLAECGGSKLEAARILGVNRRTLYRRDERAAHGDPPVEDDPAADDEPA